MTYSTRMSHAIECVFLSLEEIEQFKAKFEAQQKWPGDYLVQLPEKADCYRILMSPNFQNYFINTI